ncbi:hypothetical protein TB1_013482 [Malus domestica]
MVQVSFSRAFIFVQMLLFAFLAAVSAQESALAPAPMDVGAAYFSPVNGVVIGASLLISVFAFFKH